MPNDNPNHPVPGKIIVHLKIVNQLLRTLTMLIDEFTNAITQLKAENACLKKQLAKAQKPKQNWRKWGFYK